MKDLLKKAYAWAKLNKGKVSAGLVSLLGLIGVVLAPEQAQEVLEGIFAIVDIVDAQ